jgi:hypothetical protein
MISREPGLSCGRMTRLLAHSLPFPPSFVTRHQVVSLSQSFFVSPVELLTGEGEEGGAWAKTNNMSRNSLTFYKSFNTLWSAETC